MKAIKCFYICQSTEWYRYNLCIFLSGFSVKLCLKEKNEMGYFDNMVFPKFY